MKESSQDLPDKILWTISNNGRKMKRSELRRRTGLRIQGINPIIEELEREGKIRIDSKDYSREIASIYWLIDNHK